MKFSKLIRRSNSAVEWLGNSKFVLIEGVFLYEMIGNPQHYPSRKVYEQSVFVFSPEIKVRVLTMQPSDGTRYLDVYIAMREGKQARFWNRLYRLSDKYGERLSVFEARMFKIKRGEMFPIYTLSGIFGRLLYGKFI